MATGATVGAATAAAIQLQKSPQNQENAVKAIVKAAAVTGLTVGAVNLVGNSLQRENQIFSFAAMFLTGTTMMYLLNSQNEKGK